VNFRPQGERGMGGPIYGDVLCADGVYLPHVWEMDMHTSYDGRWLRTGFYDSEAAHLVDRKSRRSWVISKPEGELLDAIHWRMPRWSGESINESGIADDAHVIMSDASFEAWLGAYGCAAAAPAAGGGSLGAGRLPAGRSRPAHADSAATGSAQPGAAGAAAAPLAGFAAQAALPHGSAAESALAADAG
jgi:hypothetical protein